MTTHHGPCMINITMIRDSSTPPSLHRQQCNLDVVVLKKEEYLFLAL